MRTSYDELCFVYNKLLITIKLTILVVLVVGNIEIFNLFEIYAPNIIYYVLATINILMLTICLRYVAYLLSESFLIISLDCISFVEYLKKFNSRYILKWDEIDRFEKKEKFIFFKEIHVITKNPYARNYNIRIRESEYSRDYIYDMLTEQLKAWNENNNNLENSKTIQDNISSMKLNIYQGNILKSKYTKYKKIK